MNRMYLMMPLGSGFPGPTITNAGTGRAPGSGQLPSAPSPEPRAKNGQSIVEICLLILVVAVALTVFFSFIQSAVSFRLKSGSDTFGHGLLYGNQLFKEQ